MKEENSLDIMPVRRNKDGRKKRNKGKRQQHRRQAYAERVKAEAERRAREDRLAAHSPLHILRFRRQAEAAGLWQSDYQSAADELITTTCRWYGLRGIASPFGHYRGSGLHLPPPPDMEARVLATLEGRMHEAVAEVGRIAGADASAAVACLCINNAAIPDGMFRTAISGMRALAVHYGYIRRMRS